MVYDADKAVAEDPVKSFIDKMWREAPVYQSWKNAVYNKDGYRCQKCGSNRGYNAHHKARFNEDPSQRFVLTNGVTLCRKCHYLEHFGNKDERLLDSIPSIRPGKHHENKLLPVRKNFKHSIKRT